MRGAYVCSVLPGSIAEEADIQKGDIILEVNEKEIHDELDFRFYTASDLFSVTVQKQNGDTEIIEIENPDMEDMGIEFERALFSGAKSCSNRCIFCFIDQLPEGMRDTLYFKDDDSRLSFLTGNYITLTNASDDDIDKIIKMRLDPVNISVHTTNPALRRKMLGNKRAGELMGHMRRLALGGIHQNCQIVLVKGVNDGDELLRSVNDLAALHPYVTSLSVVPVGITRYRQGLYPLKPFSKEDSGEVLSIINEAQERLLKTIGTRFVYAADEFYVNAKREVPHSSDYEGFPQIENGVGLIRSLKDELLDAIAKKPPNGERNVTLVTGEAAYQTLCVLKNAAEDMYPQIKIDVVSVKNEFFGGHITVSGLLTGSDLVRALSGQKFHGKVMIPDVMLRHGTDIFLDDMTVGELSRIIGTQITVSPCTGGGLWNEIIL